MQPMDDIHQLVFTHTIPDGVVVAISGMEDYVCQIVTGSVVFLTRVLSVKYNICLPVLKGEQ